MIKIKFKCSIELEVKSSGYLLASPPSIMKFQDVQIREYRFTSISLPFTFRNPLGFS
jgi:hypothetical protein